MDCLSNVKIWNSLAQGSGTFGHPACLLLLSGYASLHPSSGCVEQDSMHNEYCCLRARSGRGRGWNEDINGYGRKYVRENAWRNKALQAPDRRYRGLSGLVVCSAVWSFRSRRSWIIGALTGSSAVQDLDDGRPIEAMLHQGLNRVP